VTPPDPPAVPTAAVPTPDAQSPDASTPDASTSDASTSDASTSDASTPDASTPDASTPDASTPDASTPDAPVLDAHAIPPTPAPEGVLIVDDSGDSRQLLMSLLRRLTDAELRQARNGEDALVEFMTRPPRLTFLDIDMGGLDGLEVLRRIRAASPEAFVVMVSGRSSAQNVRVALDEGAGAFVVKPFKPQRIIDVLAKYVKETGDRSILIGG